ncbi:thioredoxin family protein [Indibacter alkaliphilus LW1]|uniref:Thioredoxin family protein n=1 Tax=Indibacter alkaliphilus (strain CCUG 57479 / KCTC 22604 / LW1) TaxID=1189612 RepID=S2DME6_INDAL|nr:TlpA disulfide reductase family protein [Indibacter alkaliphilus]EOZ98375.1 thioredoxin family protein [Indibacter alkaliphilus LW1]
MKVSPFFWIVFTFFVFGCSQNEPVNTKIIIAGILENSEAEEIKLYLDDEIAETALDEEGKFHLSLDSDESATYYLIAGRDRLRLFLSPGDSIYISADSKEFDETLTLAGDRSIENKYLIAKSDWENESGIAQTMELMKLGKEDYFKKKDSFFKKQKEAFEKLKENQELHPDFVRLEEAYLEYEPLGMDLRYPMYHGYIHKISQDSVDFPIEEAKEALKKVDLTRSDLLASNSYIAILDQIVNAEVKEIIKRDSSQKEDYDGYEKARLTAIENVLKDPEIKDQIFYNSIKPNLDYRGPVHVKTSYDKFMADNQSPKLAAQLKAIYDKWDPIMPGKEVPDLSFVNIEGEDVKLSDLKGTLVYVDIWATWCGPCIAEHPHWDKMKEEYKDKPVSFLTVSIDDSKEPWEKMVKAKNMDGLQWFAENAWKSEIAQHFNVNGIPRFILIDQEGKIIDPSADRPSGDIRTTIDQYLE